uniref:Putative secretory peptide-52 n=1 Tax=Pleurobrachia bachei TaxID=34499 RepID=M4H1E2_PLEBA|nr:putative secretory peptide-52 [Pleurobrachia bachei]|eukprot:sb/3464090/
MHITSVYFLTVAALWCPAISAEWTAVQRKVYIPWDLEATPLQIKTDSTLGSGDRIVVWMYDKNSTYISSVGVNFSSPMKYLIQYCTNSYTDLPVQPPVEVDKIWTFTKTETAFIITCNDVEVVNYLFADSSNSGCFPKWGGSDVEQIQVDTNWGKASDFYRAEWTVVQKSVNVPWDLEGTTLQIKTDFTLGISNDRIRATAPTAGQTCRTEVDKIWTITKSETNIIITCNNVEVLNYLFTDSSDDRCVTKLGGDVVEEISFGSSDTASHLYRAEWTAVERNIPWDLEATRLQIKTDSTVGNFDWIMVNMYDKDSSYIGNVALTFSSTMKYYIGSCTNSWTDLPVQPPVEVEKIWMITKTETAIIITCNNVEVLNYLFADSSNSKCVTRWGGDVVEEIQFHSWDNATDFYRAGILLYNQMGYDGAIPHLILSATVRSDRARTQTGSWEAAEPGKIITIICNRKHVLLGGDGEITCNNDYNWSTNVKDLECKPISKLDLR